MQDKHEPLGDHGALPGAPNGPPAVVAQETVPPSAEQSGGQDAGCTLKFHPLAELFPMMTGKAFDDFVEDIKINGLLDPIWTYKGVGIDGRNRLRACNKLGMQVRTREWDGDEPKLLEFVISLNLHRRHLKDAQRAMIAARLKPALGRNDRCNILTGEQLDPVINCGHGRSVKKAGDLLNVSQCSVERACKVIEKGIPDLIAAVDACKVAVSTAADLAEFQKDEQARLLAGGRSEIKKALQPIRDARKPKRKHRRAEETLPLTPPSTPPASPIQAMDGQTKLSAPPCSVQKCPASIFPGPDCAYNAWTEERLLQHFSAGRSKLTKFEHGFRLNFTANFLDELCKAVTQREYFTYMVERGLLLTKDLNPR